MSSSSHPSTSDLVEEVRELRLLVKDLSKRVAELEGKVADSEFCLVDSGSQCDGCERALAFSEPPVTSKVVVGASSAPLTGAVNFDRDAILQSIGVWLRDNLAGKRRGVSGRDQLKESSRFYLVLRAYSGEEFNPVRIFDEFTDASREVKVRGRVGDSVFVGLPSLEDCVAVTLASGRQLPFHLRDGAASAAGSSRRGSA